MTAAFSSGQNVTATHSYGSVYEPEPGVVSGSATRAEADEHLVRQASARAGKKLKEQSKRD